MTFETPDDVLEHFGVKGMQWGVRKSRSGVNRTGKQKAAVAGAGIAGYLIGSGVAARFTMNVPLALVVGGATAALGVRVSRNIIDEHGGTEVRDLGR